MDTIIYDMIVIVNFSKLCYTVYNPINLCVNQLLENHVIGEY